MGCNQSKQEDQIAADFFGGKDGSMKEAATLDPDSSQTALQQENPQLVQPQQIEPAPKQQQQQQRPRSSKTNSARTSPVPKKTQVRQSNAGRKSEFVAPPSSMSFIESNPSPPTSKRLISPPPTYHEDPTTQASARNVIPDPPVQAPPPPTPPPTMTPVPPRNNRNTGTAAAPKSSQPPMPVEPRNVEPRLLDDDDFSVAPSLDVAMRNIHSHSFDDVYQRGRKVEYHMLPSLSSGVAFAIF